MLKLGTLLLMSVENPCYRTHNPAQRSIRELLQKYSLERFVITDGLNYTARHRLCFLLQHFAGYVCKKSYTPCYRTRKGILKSLLSVKSADRNLTKVLTQHDFLWVPNQTLNQDRLRSTSSDVTLQIS